MAWTGASVPASSSFARTVPAPECPRLTGKRTSRIAPARSVSIVSVFSRRATNDAASAASVDVALPKRCAAQSSVEIDARLRPTGKRTDLACRSSRIPAGNPCHSRAK